MPQFPQRHVPSSFLIALPPSLFNLASSRCGQYPRDGRGHEGWTVGTAEWVAKWLKSRGAQPNARLAAVDGFGVVVAFLSLLHGGAWFNARRDSGSRGKEI